MIIENGKIIKLIKQKIYPLHMGNVQSLLFRDRHYFSPNLKNNITSMVLKKLMTKNMYKFRLKKKKKK